MTSHFSKTLTNLRKASKLTNRELAELANVPFSLIPGLQSGKRRVGEYQARKIGTALGLTGASLDAFVLAAIDNCAQKVLKNSQGYPAELLNYLAITLRSAGITPQQIDKYECIQDPCQGSIDLCLDNGRIAKLSTQLTLL